MAGKLGILAGGGRAPILLIEECKRQGRPVFVVALDRQADPETTEDVPHVKLRLGAAGKAVKALKKEKVDEVVLVGDVRKPSLKELAPDLWTIKFLARCGGFDQGDDKLLSALVSDLENREGFKIAGIHELLPDLLAKDGVWGAVQPDEAALEDANIAAKAALELGAADKGQAAVARAGQVIAEEDRAGTDAMLATLKPDEERAGVLAKMKKPQQEMRVDLPTMGEDTVNAAAEAGLAGVAVQAGAALVLDQDAVIKAADDAGLFVMGIEPA